MHVFSYLSGIFWHMVSKEDIRVEPTKIEETRGWTRPTSNNDIQSLVGLVGSNKWLVQWFFTIAYPFTWLTPQSVIFQCYDDGEENYKNLNTLLTLTHVFTLPKEGFYFCSYYDASGVRLGSTLIC